MSERIAAEEYRRIATEWIEGHDLTYNGSADSFAANGTTVDNVTIASRIHLEDGRPGLSERKLLTTLNWLMEEYRAQLIDEVCNDLGAGGDDDDEVERLIFNLMPSTASDADRLDACCALRHWMHNVKRSLKGLPQHDHLMLIFRGPQGCGKSTFVDRLLSPLRSLARRDNFSIFTDSFAASRAHFAYAILLDEMGMVSRAEAATLKDALTAPYVGGRKMHSMQTQQLRRNASYIATTNTEPPHGLRDETGARRFYSIECGGQVAGARGRYLAQFNPMIIWDSVDETDTTPLSKRLTSIRAFQDEHLRARAPLEEMMEECTRRMDDAKCHLLVSDLCRRLKGFQDEHNHRGAVPVVRDTVPLLRTLGYTVVNHSGLYRVQGLAWALAEGIDDEPGSGRPRDWRPRHLRSVPTS